MKAMLGLTAMSCIWLMTLGCRSNGDFSLLGYTTRPSFDPNIRSVHIPIFKLEPFITTPDRGVEIDLTEEVVREINARKSPIRVESNPAAADTILIGTIKRIDKNVLVRNPQNLTREAEVTITVEVVWRDQRTGEYLTNPSVAKPRVLPGNVFDPSVQPEPPAAPDPKAVPITIAAMGRALVEFGESRATANQAATKRLAKLIVDRLESDWSLDR